MFYARTPVHGRGGWGIWRPGQATSSLTRRRAVQLYSGWRYVIVLAGPEQAASWNRENMWNWSLPALMFPQDRSWLVSLLWDDDWVSIGGSTKLITRLQGHQELASVTHLRSPEDPDAAPLELRA